MCLFLKVAALPSWLDSTKIARKFWICCVNIFIPMLEQPWTVTTIQVGNPPFLSRCVFFPQKSFSLILVNFSKIYLKSQLGKDAFFRTCLRLNWKSLSRLLSKRRSLKSSSFERAHLVALQEFLESFSRRQRRTKGDSKHFQLQKIQLGPYFHKKDRAFYRAFLFFGIFIRKSAI